MAVRRRSGRKKTQAGLEQRAVELLKVAQQNPEKSIAEVFGEPQEWMIALGDYRLLLLPFLEEWCWYDRVHGDWARTGYTIGETTFSVQGSQLLPPPKRRRRESGHAGPMRPAATAVAGPTKRVPQGPPLMEVLVPEPQAVQRVHQDGRETPVPVMGSCGNCGKPTGRGLAFCTNCGASLGMSSPASPPAPAAPAAAPACPGCGKPVRPGAKFCRSCGKKIL